MLQRSNPSQDLAREAADLLSIVEVSESRSLHRLAALAARDVPACSGAGAAVWRDGEAVELAATHPELSGLFSLAVTAPAHPWADALAAGQPVSCPDTLAEDRWPDTAAAALARGVRCFAILVHQAGPAAVTLALYGVRPRSLDADQVTLAELLVAFGAAILGNASAYGASQRTALQLQDAATSRMVVDQAKGILMHALGCTAAEAFAKMRAVSQARGVKVAEVAARVIEGHAAGAGLSGPAGPDR